MLLMKQLPILIGLSCLMLLAGCDAVVRKSDKIIVAECYGEYLYDTDLKEVIAESKGHLDSLARTNAFIDSWIHRRVLVHQAEKYLSPQQRDFKKQIDEYRNSLLIYTYETELIEQMLDTVVSSEEIERYYLQNPGNFQLRHTLVKAAYVVLPLKVKYYWQIRKLMAAPDTLKLEELDALASPYVISSRYNVDEWMRLDDLLNEVPIEIYNTESFLKQRRFVSFEKDACTYMVRFNDYLLEESVSPIEMEYDNIRKLILMKRKKELLDQMRFDLYEKAVKDNAFTVY